MVDDPTVRRIEYQKEIRAWALSVLESIRNLPDTAEKQTILMQVNKLKDTPNLNEGNLPAFAGAVAVLTSKVAQLLKGQRLETIYPRERVVSLITSNLLKKFFMQNPMVMMNLKDFLEVGAKKGTSPTLEMLSKSGH